MAHVFDYARPKELTEVVKLLSEHGSQANILAGGTDLIVNMKEGMLKPSLLIDIKDIPSINKITEKNGRLYIGAGVTFTTLIESSKIKESFPMLWDAARTVASSGVRSRATLAGNICSAVPSLDSATPLLCHEAIVHCISVEEKREIPISEWFIAPRKTSLRANEMVWEISLELPKKKQAGIYLKLGRYGGEDLAQAGWGFLIDEDKQYKVAHCALAPIPKRATLIEQALNGKELSPEQIEAAVALIPQEVAPITDIRSSKEYRMHICSVMIRRGLAAANDRLLGKEINPMKLLGGTQ